MNMFKGAYTHYYSIKKDFHQDEAWTYYAPAVEMAALSMFMVNAGGSAEKKYRVDYMEDSVAKYLTVCQSPEFAVRATLFDALCLQNQGIKRFHIEYIGFSLTCNKKSVILKIWCLWYLGILQEYFKYILVYFILR